MNQENIGKFIAESRKKKQLTQKELADKIGVTNKAISKWENGRGMPDYSLFQPLCEALNISVLELLNGKEGNNDIGFVDYLKYKEKQNFKKILVLIIFTLLIILVSILSIYFVNSYKKINVYELKGESENFYYDQGLIIKSNIKNVIQYGDLRSNTINDEDIISVSLSAKIDDEYYPISNFTTNLLISEKYGYGEYFNDKTLAHVPEDLYIIIFYEKEGKVIYEELKIESTLIFSNDKIVNLKNESEYNEDLKPLNLNQYDKLFELRDKALQDGFGYNEVYYSYLHISNCLTKKLSSNEYVGFDYRNYLDTFRYYIEKDDFVLKLNVVFSEGGKPVVLGFRVEETENTNNITYRLDTDEIICDESLMKYKYYVLKAKDLFLEYYIQ